jgi:hypothetical protein
MHMILTRALQALLRTELGARPPDRRRAEEVHMTEFVPPDFGPFQFHDAEMAACLDRCKRALELCESEFPVGDTCDLNHEDCTEDCHRDGADEEF